MYAIIYWEDDNEVRPILNKDGTLFLCERLEDADWNADRFEKEHVECEARVISIEGVCE